MNYHEELALSHREETNLCELNGASCANCLRKDCPSEGRECPVTAAPQDSMETATDDVNKPVAQVFEDILGVIKSRGKFQTRLNLIFCYIGSFFVTMCILIYYTSMQTPDHWCHVPGREYTNFSREEWKIITIPQEDGKFSKCKMFNLNITRDSTNASTVPCQHGWEYNDTWYSLTIPSEMNWVCDKSSVASDVIFYSQVTAAILALFFGYGGDMFGRRPQIILCLSALVLSRLVLVLTPSVLVLFILAESLAAGAYVPFFESTLSLGMELTDIQHRSSLNRNWRISVCLGITCSGLVAWVFRNWKHGFLFTTSCCFLLLFFVRWVPESPRWLACRGRQQEALAVLRRIAATNGSRVPPFTPQVLRRLADSKRDARGFLSIFSSWNLLKNTLILVVARAAAALTIFSVLLSVGLLRVHPFVTIAIEGVAQLLAVLLVHAYVSRVGRRWTSVAAILLCGVTSAAVALLLHVGAPGIAIMSAAAILQFFIQATVAMVNLQSLEIHPTCLRQITTGIEMCFSSLVMSLVPYVIFVGGSVDRRLPFIIIAGVNVVAAFLVSFLPESALQKLPDTLQDAAVFGRGQPYWSWRPRATASFLPEGQVLEDQ